MVNAALLWTHVDITTYECGSKRKVSSIQFSSVAQSCTTLCARHPCPSPTPRVHSDSRPSSQRCHPAISSSVIPFSSCPQSLPASESFLMSQLYDPAVPLLGIYPEETNFERDTCIPLFVAALFTIVSTWKQPRCPLTDEWIKKFWYIYTMEYCCC